MAMLYTFALAVMCQLLGVAVHRLLTLHRRTAASGSGAALSLVDSLARSACSLPSRIVSTYCTIDMANSGTHSLFFYGTLVHPRILARVIGSNGDHLNTQDALLLNHTRHHVVGEGAPRLPLQLLCCISSL